MKPSKLMLAALGLAWTLTACGGGDDNRQASSTPASTSTGPSADEIVAAHNSWRSAVGVPALAYSDTLAASAQAWADNLKTTKNCAMTHSGGPTGENLYWAGAWSNGPAQTVTPKQVVDAWSSEKVNYDYANNSCAAGKTCGHYTQVVWKNTTSVGCGMAICDSPKNQVWVCQYLAAGNYVGQKPY